MGKEKGRGGSASLFCAPGSCCPASVYKESAAGWGIKGVKGFSPYGSRAEPGTQTSGGSIGCKTSALLEVRRFLKRTSDGHTSEKQCGEVIL